MCIEKDVSKDMDELYAEVEADPYNRDAYSKLISCLRLQKNKMFKELRSCRISMLKYLVPLAEEWDEWYDDELGNKDLKDRFCGVKQYFELRLNDDPSSSALWKNYIDFLISYHEQSEAFISRDELQVAIEKGVTETMYDIPESHLVWNAYYQFILNNMNKKPYNLDFVKKIIIERLKVPHLKLQETWSLYSSFISSHFNKVYESEMLNAQKFYYTPTKKLLDFIESNEIKALQKEYKDDPLFWTEYLKLKGNKSFKKLPILTGIFERAVRNRFDDTNWIPVWQDFINLSYEYGSISIRKFLKRFVRTYPNSCLSWCAYIWDLEINELDEFNDAKTHILKNYRECFNHEVPYDNTKKLIGAIIRWQLKFYAQNKAIYADFKDDLNYFFTLAVENHSDDVYHTIERLVIQACDIIQENKMCLQLLKLLTSNEILKQQAEVWLLRIQYEQKLENATQVSKVFKEAIFNAVNMDWPERIFDEYIRYEEIFGSMAAYMSAENYVKKSMKEVNNKRIEEQEQTILQELKHDNNNNNNNNKRSIESGPSSNTVPANKKIKIETKPTRDREHLTVLVKNLPLDITQARLQAFFKDCGTIFNISIIKTNDDSSEASIEFTNYGDVLAALTKNFKKIDGKEIEVQRAINTTCWVTNFPPTANKEFISDVFSKFGNVLSIRFPSLASNTSRRFCYVEFSSSEAAYRASKELDDKEFKDKTGNTSYRLVVKISNPEIRKQRSGATEEGREVYVSKLDFHKVDKNKLSEIFSRFGEIEKIHMPLSLRSKSMGRLHDGYGFITFATKKSAQDSLELNHSILEGRPIDVSIAEVKSKKRDIIESHDSVSLTNTQYDLIGPKTISVLNISDKISALQLKDFLESQVGSVRRIDLRRDIDGALVEFEFIKDAGKAEMLLTGKELDGRVIKIGDRKELNKIQNIYNTEKTTFNKKNDSLMVPSALNRRNRRMKFNIHASTENGNNHIIAKDNDGNRNTDMKEKTNADFRKMFLNKK
ncbi:hypothetical protein PACTADRAFT_40089 [Pachysolen tannophilus NRRL Y-2460]|uniref:RRM domain-containing protein n=1 Tax=Pachysolen tannophilus NRRL Y-2460 TaxID=669874 RepID=A0A1E4TYK9_PACTA|nr:hypothetical protein PACTADRAFT_40089 [Pachysolen tannophilus NRRL Y-2460]